MIHIVFFRAALSQYDEHHGTESQRGGESSQLCFRLLWQSPGVSPSLHSVFLNERMVFTVYASHILPPQNLIHWKFRLSASRSVWLGHSISCHRWVNFLFWILPVCLAWLEIEYSLSRTFGHDVGSICPLLLSFPRTEESFGPLHAGQRLQSDASGLHQSTLGLIIHEACLLVRQLNLPIHCKKCLIFPFLLLSYFILSFAFPRAVVVGHFCNNNAYFILLSWLPTYFQENFPGAKVLNPLSSNLSVSAVQMQPFKSHNLLHQGWVFNVVPWCVAIPTQWFAGWFADHLMTKGEFLFLCFCYGFNLYALLSHALLIDWSYLLSSILLTVTISCHVSFLPFRIVNYIC